MSACTHEFFWPLRAADGRYYQVCRSCGVQCEYDWMTMDGWAVCRSDACIRKFRAQPQPPS